MQKKCRLLAAAQQKVREMEPGRIARLFHELFTLPPNFEQGFRKRIFIPVNTFVLFLYQVLVKDCSCAGVMQYLSSFFATQARKPPSLNTASYCAARLRLCFEKIKEILRTNTLRAQEEISKEQLWCGRRVKVADGTGCKLPDTKENQADYPQPKSQKKGCGNPVIRIVVLFCLATGMILEWATGSLNVSETELFRSMLDALKARDVFVADRGFGGFVMFHLILQRGADFVVRIKERSRKRLKVLRKISKNERIVIWYRPKIRPAWLAEDIWKTVPETLKLREISYQIDAPGFRTSRVVVITNLMDRQDYPAASFKDLYKLRWRAELHLREIKTTMGMEQLTCKTPEMIKKEILMHFIGYNLIRATMQKAASLHGVPIERISFKASVNLFVIFCFFLELLSDFLDKGNLMNLLYSLVAQCKVPERPNRREPRTVKQRMKPYPLMTSERSEFQEVPHRGKRPNS